MTLHLDWLRTGRAPRGTPRRRRAPRRLVALGLIAGLALLQTGCQSWPLSNCGSCNPCGFLRRTTARILNRPSGCCGSGASVGSGVEYSAPSTVVGPSTTGGPLYSPGTSSGSIPSTVPPSDAPTILSPNETPPSSRPGAPPSTGSTSGSGTRPTSYVGRTSATKTAVRLDAGMSTGRASLNKPARDKNGAGASETTSGEEENPLDHLPPLALPGEVTQAVKESPTPSASRPEGNPGPRDGVSLLGADPGAEPESPAATGTGIARFASVDPMLAGGSLPTAAGLGWLAEKGYRTVLDLRPSAEVTPAFIAEVAARGLRYVALPVHLDRLDADRLSRFQFELAATEARPLYFFDSDGARAGALWYIRRVTVDRVDPQMARREAEEIGLKDASAWQLTTTYVEGREAAKAHPAGNARGGAADPPAPPAVGSEKRGASASSPGPERGGETGAEPAGDPVHTLDASTVDPGSAIPGDMTTPKSITRRQPADMPPHSLPFQQDINWRPYAAMLLTGLGLPLAYWSRTAIPDAIARARASLPGPGPRPRSLPHESGD